MENVIQALAYLFRFLLSPRPVLGCQHIYQRQSLGHCERALLPCTL